MAFAAPEVYFEPNDGQADPSVAYVARGPGYSVLLARDGAALYRSLSLFVEFPGKHTLSAVAGESLQAAVTNYYRATVRTGIPHFDRVRYRGFYPGIDLVWTSRNTDLEYKFLVSPSADPNLIRMRFRGASRLALDDQGDLLVASAAGTIRHRHPIAWQEIAGHRRDVPIALRLSRTTAHFQIGAYDRHYELRIDPVLAYSTYLGGAGGDAGYAIASDTAGSVYITGTTASIGFPAWGSTVNYHGDAFVMKFNASGTLLYNTVLSSNGNTSGQALAVDAGGNVYIAGTTQSSNFPVTKGAWQTVFGGVADAFAAKLDATGKMAYATYIGGTGQETGTGIAIDTSGNAYISGYTTSLFPTTSTAAQKLYAGGFSDAFLLKLNTTGSTALYSTLLGGTGNDIAEAVAVDSSGHACIAGYTDSSALVVHAPVQVWPGGEGDALVACLSADGSAWTMVSYLGGSNLDQAYALKMDATGNLYVAGATFSSDFPVTAGVVQTRNAGSYDAFVVKLTPGGSTISYSTYLGGSASDAAVAIAIGSAGDVWIGGYTISFNFPLVNPIQTTSGASFDGFISHLNADGGALLMSSYLGGTGDDRVLGIALDSAGNVFVTGSTQSVDFPVTPGALQSASPAGINAFLTNIRLSVNSISGQLINSSGVPLSGVTLTLSGALAGSQLTDSSGRYLFNNLQPGGSYTVTPSLGAYVFSPASQTFTSLNANQIASFTGSTSYSISGQVTLTGAGLSGVVVMLSGTVNSMTKTDTAGNYSFTGLNSGTYTVTPTLKGYAFTPFSQQFTDLASGQTAGFNAALSAFPGTTQVVWQDPVTGYSQIWYFGGAQGTTFLSAATITTKNVWRIAATTDFNGDGYPDIVWQDPVSGTSQIWFMGGPQGVTLLEAASFSGPNPWHIVAAADFNRDGHPDIVWQDQGSGWAQIWYLGGPQGITFQSAANLTLRNPWRIVGSGDFNGDGYPDLLWQDPVKGTVQLWYLTGTLGNALLSPVNLTGTETLQLAAVADFNQDHHPDVVWQDPFTGASNIWLLNGTGGTTLLGTANLSGSNPWRIVAPR